MLEELFHAWLMRYAPEPMVLALASAIKEHGRAIEDRPLMKLADDLTEAAYRIQATRKNKDAPDLVKCGQCGRYGDLRRQ